MKLLENEGGGWFDSAANEIGIGTKYKKDIPDTLLHEILEAIITERCHRYHIFDGTNDKLLFSFNHAEFANIVRDLTSALQPLMRGGG